MLGRIILFDFLFTDMLLYTLWQGYLLPVAGVRKSTYDASVMIATGVTEVQSVFLSPIQLAIFTFYLTAFTLAIIIP